MSASPSPWSGWVWATPEQVCTRYPFAVPDAVKHVLWMLARMLEYLEIGDPDMAGASVLSDWGKYDGPRTDLVFVDLTPRVG